MKIAIDCHTLEIKNWAGKEQYLFFVLKEIIKIDKKNEYILYFRKRVFKDGYFPPHWKIRNINLPTPFWQIFVLLDLFFKKADILFVPCTYLLPALSFFIPTYVVAHDLTTFLGGIKKTHKYATVLREKLLLKLAIKNSKSVIAVSKNTKKDLIKLFKIPFEKIRVIYLASNHSFRPIKNKEKIKNVLFKYNIPEKFILFVGTLEPRKNIIGLIKAYNDLIINYKLSDYKLVIVGKKGWHYQKIFSIIKELNLGADVIFTGYMHGRDMPYVYNAASCFVYPSFYEGFGLPVLEAMNCGCPVITSNNSSLTEVAGEAAILINPYNFKEISKALYKILSDSCLMEDMKKKGLNQAQKFSWFDTVKNTLNVFS